MKPPQEFKVLYLRECASTLALLETPVQVTAYWRENIPQADWFDPSKESFVVMVLNTRRRILGHNLVSLGTLDSCCVHPRDVFRPAIAIAGHAIVLAHNHPSGNPEPSSADVRVTQDLINAGKLLRIEVLDHVIIGSPSPERHKDYASLKELGFFNT